MNTENGDKSWMTMQISRQMLMTVLFCVFSPARSQQSAIRVESVIRPQGPCDILGAANTPCVAAHSTTRALYASYNGPLYQVTRRSDGKTLDVGLIGAYADADAQDLFCTRDLCLISVVYDQSGKGNHLYQAAPGTFKGPAKGGFDTLPIADMAPITINGHKAYGVYIIPGMGLRNNNARGVAINDEAEGIYYVVDGTHFDSGCCFDYGNSSTNGRAVGTGTMETTYFGTSTVWGRGAGPGPWIMSDMEAGLFSGQGAKQNEGDPTINSWRFVTAVMDGGSNHWDLRGGDAQKGNLTTFYSGPRPSPNSSGGYSPMRKQGGILLGTGGDNGNGSSGTFYEGVITSGFPSEVTTNSVQANIVSAKYDVQRLTLSRVTSFSPGSTKDVTITFTNTTGMSVNKLRLHLALPDKGWRTTVSGTTQSTKRFMEPIAPGTSVSATFRVTSPTTVGSGFLTAHADWVGASKAETFSTRIRNVLPVKINEVRFGTSTNSTNQFIELYNSSSKALDLGHWTLIHTASQWAPVKLATIPAGTRIASHAFYLLGLSTSGLAAPASAGDMTIRLRSISGFSPGQSVDIEGERRTIARVGTPASPPTTVFIPVSTGPWVAHAIGTTNLPVTNAAGFEVGQKIGIDLGGKYESATVTVVGKAATQTVLSAAANAGDINIKLANASNVSEGDVLTIGAGSLLEVVKVVNPDTSGAVGTGITIASPLHFNHSESVDVAGPGSGISFTPATKSQHLSGDSVQALGSGVTLDRPLSRSHTWGAPVLNELPLESGYQGSPTPNQWFGGSLTPTIVATQTAGGQPTIPAGSLALMDATGNVVDAIVYGSQQSNSSGNGTVASPELATLEGDQSQGGCIAVTSSLAGGEGRSVGRFPDGADSDTNCADFYSQTSANVLLSTRPGVMNVKVSTVAGFEQGQSVIVGTGPDQEIAVIDTVGSAGATTLSASTASGATVIPIASPIGFSPGQNITIDSGANGETAVVISVTRQGSAHINVATPLSHDHAAGASLSGSGITFQANLKKSHAVGSPISTQIPTPGRSNMYAGHGR